MTFFANDCIKDCGGHEFKFTYLFQEGGASAEPEEGLIAINRYCPFEMIREKITLNGVQKMMDGSQESMIGKYEIIHLGARDKVSEIKFPSSIKIFDVADVNINGHLLGRALAFPASYIKLIEGLPQTQ